MNTLRDSSSEIVINHSLGECTWYDGCGIERNMRLDTLDLHCRRHTQVECLMTRFDVQQSTPPAFLLPPVVCKGRSGDDKLEGD